MIIIIIYRYQIFRQISIDILEIFKKFKFIITKL